jgi:hypothetical protein
VRTNQEKEEDDGDFDDGKWMMQLARERETTEAENETSGPVTGQKEWWGG